MTDTNKLFLEQMKEKHSAVSNNNRPTATVAMLEDASRLTKTYSEARLDQVDVNPLLRTADPTYAYLRGGYQPEYEQSHFDGVSNYLNYEPSNDRRSEFSREFGFWRPVNSGLER